MKRYDMTKIKERGSLFNAIISARKAGKTFQIKINMVKEWLENKNRFVYVRRRDVEITASKMSTFFDKIQAKGYYTEHELKYEKGAFYCDGELMGWTMALSTSHNDRSMDFVNVTDIYFEEFVILVSNTQDYLDNEVEKFLDLYETINRDDTDIRVWFLGNKIHEFNPYFLYFDIIPPKEGIKTINDFSVEVWKNDDFSEQRTDTRFGKMIKNTSFGDYSIKNESFVDNTSFVKQIPNAVTPIFGVVHNGTVVYFLQHKNSMKWYVTSNKKYTVAEMYCTSISDERPDIQFIKKARSRRNGWLHYYIEAVKRNNVFYACSKDMEVGRDVNKFIYF